MGVRPLMRGGHWRGFVWFAYPGIDYRGGDYTRLTAVAPLWSIAGASALLPAARLLARRVVRLLHKRRARLATPGRCHSCGYDLRATPDHCPECGTVSPHVAACNSSGN